MRKRVAHISPALFIPPYSSSLSLDGRQRGSPRSHVRGRLVFSAQTHAVSDGASSVARVSAAATSKADLPEVPALLEAPP